MRQIAPYLPTDHNAQLARTTVGIDGEGIVTSAGWLVGYAVALFSLALFAYRRGEGLRFG